MSAVGWLFMIEEKTAATRLVPSVRTEVPAGRQIATGAAPICVRQPGVPQAEHHDEDPDHEDEHVPADAPRTGPSVPSPTVA